HTVREAAAGIVDDDYVGASYRSSGIATRLNRRNVMNVYFTQLLHTRFNDADGNVAESNPLAHAGNRWDFDPSCVFTSKASNMDALARVLAHEFGHMLRITRAEHAHADDRGVATPWRSDIWSRMRLMSKYVNFDVTNPDRSWQDATYGPYDANTMASGDMISVKNLANDGTDNELAVSRGSVRANPYAHHGLALPADA
ncbi:MAG: hypothetical protein M3Y08_19235, partial [Fibrobacterota bacterium]|nr:hypothetical protein [Fibrobacterota bacterium]